METQRGEARAPGHPAGTRGSGSLAQEEAHGRDFWTNKCSWYPGLCSPCSSAKVGNQDEDAGSLRSLSPWAGLSDSVGTEGTERDCCRGEREPPFLEGLRGPRRSRLVFSIYNISIMVKQKKTSRENAFLITNHFSLFVVNEQRGEIVFHNHPIRIFLPTKRREISK